MIRAFAPVFAAVSLGALTSCKDIAANSAMQEEIKKIRTENESMRSRLEAMEKKVADIDSQESLRRFRENLRKRASFDLSAKEFQYIEHELGIFYISIQNIQPYSDGQKVTLNFGNPMNAGFNNVELEVSWSARFPDLTKLEGDARTEAHKEWEATRHSKKIKLDQTLRPGHWNPVDLVIAPAPTGKVGFLHIEKIEASRVNLQR